MACSIGVPARISGGVPARVGDRPAYSTRHVNDPRGSDDGRSARSIRQVQLHQRHAGIRTHVHSRVLCPSNRGKKKDAKQRPSSIKENYFFHFGRSLKDAQRLDWTSSLLGDVGGSTVYASGECICKILSNALPRLACPAA